MKKFQIMDLNLKNRGFTLIELLVVIAIIGILAAMVTVSFTSSQRQARDTQRKSDLTQYRSTLESYANKNDGLYPAHATATAPDSFCASELELSITCPVDPKEGTSPYGYRYVSDGSSGATATKYTLYTHLENSSNYWIVCANGTTATKATVPTISDCP